MRYAECKQLRIYARTYSYGQPLGDGIRLGLSASVFVGFPFVLRFKSEVGDSERFTG